MPQIREYSAPEGLGLRPDQTGVTARANAARRVQGAYNEAAQSLEVLASSKRQIARTEDEKARMTLDMGRRIGSAVETVGDIGVKYLEHREISQNARTLAGLHQQATQRWNETARNADPNDPTVGPKFLESLETEFEKFSGAFLTEGGQRWGLSQVNRFREHMTTKVASDQATMAGQALAVNLDQTKNLLSSTVRNDPTAIDETLKLWESTVDSLVQTSPTLNATVASKVRGDLLNNGKGEIIKSGLIGLAAINPDAATKVIESGRYGEFLSGAEAKTIIANARQQVRAARVDENYQRSNAEKAAKAASDERESQYLKPLFSDDPLENAKVSTKAIVNDPVLSTSAKERLVRIVEREQKPEAPTRVSHAAATDLFARMRAPEGDPTRITDSKAIDDAYIAGKLTRADHTWLRTEFKESRTPDGERLSEAKREFFQAVGPMIDKSNPLMGKLDQSGKMNTYRLEWALNQKIAEYRKAGKNPYDLLDPAKPDFMGSPAALAPYMKPIAESIRDQAQRLRGGSNLTGPDREIISVDTQPAPPKVERARKPGESPAQYLKRMGYD